MALTAEQKELVQRTWAKVQKVGGEDGHAVTKEIFYPELFKHKEVAALFKKTNMAKQATALWKMLGSAVKGLDNLDSLVPVLQESGKRHIKYGVKDEHYDVVGAALLHTLRTGLGEEFTPDVEKAWTTVYSVVATTMKAQNSSENRKRIGLTPRPSWLCSRGFCEGSC